MQIVTYRKKTSLKDVNQSMTCDVRLQLAEVRSAVASCDVRAEPILVVICGVCACGAL